MSGYPADTHLLLILPDENLVLESAVLHYSSVVTGEQFEMPASAIVNKTVRSEEHTSELQSPS